MRKSCDDKMKWWLAIFIWEILATKRLQPKSGCCFTLGSAMVSWCSRKQTSLALSTVEAEYIALCVAVREAVWLRKLLANYLDMRWIPLLSIAITRVV
jgi:hypothetical protein